MADYEAKVLVNGLLIEEIPMELRTEKICINALKWGLKIYNINDCEIRKEMCFRIMNSFPKETLLTGFVIGHLSHFA